MNNQRLCVKCASPLAPVAVAGLQVEGCPECGGFWFDAEELGRLAKAGPGELGALEHQLDHGAGPRRTADPRGVRLCPGCRVSLRDFEYPWARGIRLDGCPECRGIWVDDGELSRIERTLQFLRRGQPADGGAAPTATSSPTAAAAPSRGARVAASVLLASRCPKCGERNSDAAMVCWACGAHLKERAEGLLCAICHGPMMRFSAHGMSLDGCQGCGGLWLDMGELGSLLQLPATALAGVQSQLGPRQSRPAAAHPPMLSCPACHRAMQEHPYGKGSGVRVDACSECRGVWLDAGELRTLRAFITRQTAG